MESRLPHYGSPMKRGGANPLWVSLTCILASSLASSLSPSPFPPLLLPCIFSFPSFRHWWWTDQYSSKILANLCICYCTQYLHSEIQCLLMWYLLSLRGHSTMRFFCRGVPFDLSSAPRDAKSSLFSLFIHHVHVYERCFKCVLISTFW